MCKLGHPQKLGWACSPRDGGVIGQDFLEISGGDGERLRLALLLLVVGLDRVKAFAATSKEQSQQGAG